MLSVWSASASAACALPLMLLAASTAAPASTVSPILTLDPSTSLSATAASSLTPPGETGDSKNDSGSGDLTTPSASASATAHLGLAGDQPDRSASATSNANLVISSDSFELAGKTTAGILPDSAFTADAQAHGVASVLVPFTINNDGGTFNYSVNISTLVLKNEKITLLLDRTGGNPSSLLNQVFDSSSNGSLGDLSSGSYRLQLISGSEATNHGVQGEHGSAQFDLTVSAPDQGGGGGVVIPLPNPFAAGVVMLGAMFGGLWLVRRRGRIGLP